MGTNSLTLLKIYFTKLFYSPEHHTREDEMSLEFKNKFCYFSQLEHWM